MIAKWCDYVIAEREGKQGELHGKKQVTKNNAQFAYARRGRRLCMQLNSIDERSRHLYFNGGFLFVEDGARYARGLHTCEKIDSKSS